MNSLFDLVLLWQFDSFLIACSCLVLKAIDCHIYVTKFCSIDVVMFHGFKHCNRSRILCYPFTEVGKVIDYYFWLHVLIESNTFSSFDLLPNAYECEESLGIGRLTVNFNLSKLVISSDGYRADVAFQTCHRAGITKLFVGQRLDLLIQDWCQLFKESCFSCSPELRLKTRRKASIDLETPFDCVKNLKPVWNKVDWICLARSLICLPGGGEGAPMKQVQI